MDHTYYMPAVGLSVTPACVTTLGIITNETTDSQARPVLALREWATFTGDREQADMAQGEIRLGKAGSDLWRSLARRAMGRAVLPVYFSGGPAALAAAGLWEEISTGRLRLQTTDWRGTCILSDPPTIVVVREPITGATLRLVDVGNYAIRPAADQVDAGVLAMSLADYLFRWFAVVSRERMGPLQATLAGQAHAAWRASYLDCPVLIHRNRPAQSVELASYYPGRCEPFRIGRVEGPIYELDARAYYPTLARGALFPSRLKRVFDATDVDYDKLANEWPCVIAECLIETDTAIVPKRRKDATVFPVGRFWTTLCGPELNWAANMDCLVRLGRTCCYDSSEVFRPLCSWLLDWRRRAEADVDPQEIVWAKAVGKTIWGRFAKRKRGWRNDPTVTPTKDFSEWYEVPKGSTNQVLCRSIGGLGQSFQELGLDRLATPALAAWVTSLGRLAMLGYLVLAELEHVHYVATDSLFVDSVGRDRLLGKFRTKLRNLPPLTLRATHEWMEIRGIGDYSVPGADHTSGIPLDAERNGGQTGTWQSPELVSAQLRRGEKPSPLITPRAKSTAGKYRHGRVAKDGTVLPLVLEEV